MTWLGLIVFGFAALGAAGASAEHTLTSLRASGDTSAGEFRGENPDSFSLGLADLVDGYARGSAYSGYTAGSGLTSAGNASVEFRVLEDGFEYELDAAANDAPGDGGASASASFSVEFTTTRPYHIVISGSSFTSFGRRYQLYTVPGLDEYATAFSDDSGVLRGDIELYGKSYNGQLFSPAWYPYDGPPYIPPGEWRFGDGMSDRGDLTSPHANARITFVPVIPEPSSAALIATATAVITSRQRRDRLANERRG